MRWALWGVIVLALAALAAPARADRAGAQFRYGVFSDHDDLRDTIAFYAARHFHVQLEVWDFVTGEDEFRPEVGLHWQDRRRSAYLVQWRHEKRRERYTFGTDQVLFEPFVGRVEVSPIVGEGKTEVVAAVGLDYYWGSYNFAQLTVIRDPRSGGLWVVPLRVRLSNERNDWVQLGIAPASERSMGWSVDGKWRVLRLGVERNDRYDFTDVDNIFYTLGVEFDLPRP